MLKLLGVPTSNYTNIVKLALLEKGLEFQEVLTGPGGEEYQKKSPMGKIPSLETEHGILTETHVIIDYLDELAGPSFFPSNSFKKAKVKELIRHMELYVEWPARRLYPEAIFGGSVSDETKTEVREQLEKGFNSVKALASFSPYIMGAEMTYADFFVPYAVGPATRVTKTIYDWDSMSEIPGLKELIRLLGERVSFQKVNAAQKEAWANR